MGAFTYSREENTPAASFEKQVSKKTKQSRLDRLMTTQFDIVQTINSQRVGTIEEVLCEGINDDGTYRGRTSYQAPEVDGNICFSSSKECHPGIFYKVRIDKVDNYDLFGKVI